MRVLLLLVIVCLNGCSLWPSQEHRGLTTQSIEALLAKQCQGPTEPSANDQQQLAALQRIQTQLDMLTAATPGFTNSVCSEPAKSHHEYEGKVIVGANEWIYLSPPGHHYQARVDSGAATSSLSAMDIEYFERNGKKRWVRFRLQHDDEAEAITVEAKVVRHVLIRQASSPEPERRPVVSLTVNMGQDLRYDTEFTLTDRSQMAYPILLGREFLRDVILIDVSRQFIHPKYIPQDSAQLLLPKGKTTQVLHTVMN
ncbi:MAG: ATP-dependent zinc protease [Gammaproteobacteria bacterium]|nr:ATP-dependent zinc protease [Gammaproteobacteria bacterium]